ncbi:penicillin-binding transpeptidase domain-containing protein [Romboutsia sp. 1001713B170207_170306_H8]|uniref:penicillin-binding transpeptidase domain-containing protein n=1 Tax=Romboutsia sp. 1001713B170207_170306_H8 TaxID=2787112 RepID=UPI000820E3A5|nr:penicillin-binding transpeptidase domain-containing protein [Romboutsia sp. 1001713B170207_170306_H8]SCH53259.1 Peptidoglycan synthase FtsI precursor [uncultured Clostridium sp.]
MKLKRIILLISIISFTMIFLVGCGTKDKVQSSINNYVQLLNEKKYDEFYEGLSKKSKEYIETEYGGKEGFINKYTSIYSAMNVSNIKIALKESKENLQVPISISMDTSAGQLKYDDLIIKLEKEDNEYKISWSESLILPNMIQGDKIRVQIYNGSRGRILDRDGNILAYDGEVNYIYINPKTFDKSNVSNLASILDISEEYIQNKLDSNSNPDHLIFIVKVSKYDEEKASKALEIEGVNVQVGISRVYAQGEAFGSLLGYIGNITAEELEKNSDKGYTASSQIGKNGLEQVYEEKLRSKDGVHIYIERGEEKITVAKTDSKDGEDIQLAIDSKLQQEIYNQMDNEKGASIAMNSTTGEVLAMVSSPSYDSNTLVSYKTKTIAKELEESKNAEFDNRANNAYSPGSTMKLITAAIGLENNVINPNEKMSIKGLTWQNSSSWGNYKVSRVKDIDSVGLYEATIYSDNIYFADKAIKLGREKFISGAKKFGIGADIKFEYPMAKSQISNSGSIEDEILLADTGYGQGEVLTTPLEVTMAYSSLANGGKIMAPRLVISENSEPNIYSEAISKDFLEELKKDFSGVINDPNGSGYLCKIDGVNLAGKTGTAEIKSSKDDNNGNENSWFVAVDLDNSKLSIAMVMEDMKDKSTSSYLVPKVKNVIKSYLNR